MAERSCRNGLGRPEFTGCPHLIHIHGLSTWPPRRSRETDVESPPRRPIPCQLERIQRPETKKARDGGLLVRDFENRRRFGEPAATLLHVSLSLLQNLRLYQLHGAQFDYQSVCHCSKTPCLSRMLVMEFDYQSVCHCSKTAVGRDDAVLRFDYQSVCHCSKTT